MIGSMEVPRDNTLKRRRIQDEIEVKEAEKQNGNHHGREMSPPCILSLDDEFKQLEEDKGGENENESSAETEKQVNEETLLEDLMEESYEEGGGRLDEGETMTEEELKQGEDKDWNLEEEIRLQEEMFAVKMEVEMMQKEKESWEEEKRNLEREKVDARSQREVLEQ